jgi:hypothetical protein
LLSFVSWRSEGRERGAWHVRQAPAGLEEGGRAHPGGARRAGRPEPGRGGDAGARGEERPYPHTVRALADALQVGEEDRASLLAAVPERGGGAPPVTDAPPPPPLLPAPRPRSSGASASSRRSRACWRGPMCGAHAHRPGGVGKTRLAAEAAQASLAAGHFRDGVTFVELAPLSDAGLVLTAAAQALGLREALATSGRTPAEVLRLHLQGGSYLIVLDNLEQVIEAAPDVANLMERCPASRCSRPAVPLCGCGASGSTPSPAGAARFDPGGDGGSDPRGPLRTPLPGTRPGGLPELWDHP